MDFKTVLIGLLIIALVLVTWRSCDQKSNLEDTIGMYEALQDTLHKTRNKLGQEITRTSVLTAERKKDFLRLKTGDSVILALQQEVRDYKGRLLSATIIHNTTTDTGSSVTTITRIDTFDNQIFPTYSASWDERWSRGTITANKDSITRDIRIRNEFVVTHGIKRKFLKANTVEIEVKNLNPMTETAELRSFAVRVPAKRFGLGISGGYGVNSDLKTGFYIGAGINYNIINIR